MNEQNRNKKYNYKNIVIKPDTYNKLQAIKEHPRQSFDEIITFCIKALKESKETQK